MKRRTLLGTVAVGIPTFNILRVAPSRAQSQTIRLIEAGGLSGASVEAGYIEPLLRRTGIRVEFPLQRIPTP